MLQSGSIFLWSKMLPRIGGDLLWLQPEDDSEVTDYLVYLAQDSGGTMGRKTVAQVLLLHHLRPRNRPYTYSTIGFTGIDTLTSGKIPKMMRSGPAKTQKVA